MPTFLIFTLSRDPPQEHVYRKVSQNRALELGFTMLISIYYAQTEETITDTYTSTSVYGIQNFEKLKEFSFKPHFM